jgi:hypothetical protein
VSADVQGLQGAKGGCLLTLVGTDLHGGGGAVLLVGEGGSGAWVLGGL